MVSYLSNPLLIFVTLIGAAFLLGFAEKISKTFAATIFYAALIKVVAITFITATTTSSTITINTIGFIAPLSINLQFGHYEAFFLAAVNIGALLGAIYLADYFKISILGRALFLILTLGINGMVMTRDLFNLFIFVEITSIATYGLIGLDRHIKALSAGFKYILAGGIMSIFFLLGTARIYYKTGVLNIDNILLYKSMLTGPIGLTAITLLLSAIILELKPFPANGWGLDVYQGANAGVAMMISVGVSTGALFALYKLFPLFPAQHLGILTAIGLATFFFSNLMGLKQSDAKRLLGYSSIAQMGLVVVALTYFRNASLTLFLGIVGGLFLNHFLAKAILFWIAGIVNKQQIKDWGVLAQSKLLIALFACSIFALIGLPPFPGFWAKWQLVMYLGGANHYYLIGLILLGSIFEAAYLLRWFNYTLQGSNERLIIDPLKLFSVLILGVFLVIVSLLIVHQSIGPRPAIFFIPLIASVALMLFGLFLPTKLRALLAFIATIIISYFVQHHTAGLTLIFTQMFLWGGIILSIATFYKRQAPAATYGLLLMMLASLGGLVLAKTTLEFFFSWEFMTLSSYLLVLSGKEGKKPALTYILFSLASAAFIMTGFALANIVELAGLSALSGQEALVVFTLLAIGFLIKMGAFGVHIWVPGAYAEADDDISAFISALLSKAGVFGLFVVAIYLQQTITNSPLSYALGWLGVLTATFGALMAALQEDIKKLLAYSSMGQVGYIVTAIALMSHLGWVTALYLSINHILYKSLLFLSVAGVIMRVNTRQMYKMGGLIKKMPISFVSAMMAIIAMSGVPPLTGFGGKWLLYNSLIEKGWYLQAAMAFFASGLAFLYMYRLIHSIFLGQAKVEHREVKEAPLWLTIPQIIFMGLVMGGSMFPRFWVGKLSNAVSEFIPSTLSWSGQMAQSSLGYWNGFMVMNVVGVIFVALLIWLMLTFQKVQKVKQFNIVFAGERPFTPQTTHVAYNMFAPVQKAIGGWVKPRATAFWSGVGESAHTLSHFFAGLYTGNGQTYALFMLLFFLILNYFIGAN